LIRALLGLTRMLAGEIRARAQAVYDGMNGNKNFPKPPVEMPTFKEAIDSLTAALADMLDGGKMATARKNKQVEVVGNMLRQLANYAGHNCNDDPAIFLTSGFEIASNDKPRPATLSESIRWIKPGSNSGCLLITLVAVLGAANYQLRWAPVGTSETDGEWAMRPITQIRPATEIKNLIPGTTYAFQVRALMQKSKSTAAYTDWSDSVTWMCT